MILPQLQYGSLLTYCSQENSTRTEVTHSKSIMLALKNARFIGQPPIEMPQWIAKNIKRDISTLPFSTFFQDDTILVPMPKSAPMQKGTLWVPERIALSLLDQGLGREVVPMLERVTAVPKSAWSAPQDRPLPQQHYDSMAVQKALASPKRIPLIDDIVTRGSTFLGGASRIHDEYPNCEIRAFAGMRAITYQNDFVKEYYPVKGEITYRQMVGDSIRFP